MPIHNLIQTGLIPANGKPEDFFGEGNVWYGSGYVSAVDRVLSGEAEAAAVSYYVLDKDKHLSPEQRSKLRKLQSQGPVPTHVLAIRSTISPRRQSPFERNPSGNEFSGISESPGQGFHL